MQHIRYSIVAYSARQTEVDDDGHDAGQWFLRAPQSIEGWTWTLPHDAPSDAEARLAEYFEEAGLVRAPGDVMEEPGRYEVGPVLVEMPDGSRDAVAVVWCFEEADDA